MKRKNRELLTSPKGFSNSALLAVRVPATAAPEGWARGGGGTGGVSLRACAGLSRPCRLSRYSPSLSEHMAKYCALGLVWSVWVRAGFPFPVFFPDPFNY